MTKSVHCKADYPQHFSKTDIAWQTFSDWLPLQWLYSQSLIVCHTISAAEKTIWIIISLTVLVDVYLSYRTTLPEPSLMVEGWWVARRRGGVKPSLKCSAHLSYSRGVTGHAVFYNGHKRFRCNIKAVAAIPRQLLEMPSDIYLTPRYIFSYFFVLQIPILVSGWLVEYISNSPCSSRVFLFPRLGVNVLILSLYSDETACMAEIGVYLRIQRIPCSRMWKHGHEDISNDQEN